MEIGLGISLTSWRGGATPAVPIPDVSALYFDNTDAPLGDVTSLTTRGSWGAVLSNVAFTGGAVAVMQSDGLLVSGNILRNIATRGPFSKFTLLCDIRRDGLVTSSRGDVIGINPNEGVETRCYLSYDANAFRVIGPNNVTISVAPVPGTRQTVGMEVDLVSGIMKVIEPDGFERSISLGAVSPFSINRIEIGKACAALFHQIAIIVE